MTGRDSCEASAKRTHFGGDTLVGGAEADLRMEGGAKSVLFDCGAGRFPTAVVKTGLTVVPYKHGT